MEEGEFTWLFFLSRLFSKHRYYYFFSTDRQRLNLSAKWLMSGILLKHMPFFLLQARFKEVKRGGPRQEWVRKIVRNDEESLKESGDSGGIWRYRWALLSPAEQHINWHESTFHFNWGTLTRDAPPCSKSHCSFIQVLQKCKDNKHFVGSIHGGQLASSFCFILL